MILKWHGKTYAVPIKTASYAFFYNNQLFREAGLDHTRPPRTWSEVRELSKKLTRRDERGHLSRVGFISEYGYLPMHGDMSVAVLMAWQLGARFLSDDGAKVQLANPEAVRALQWVVDMYNDYDRHEITTFISSFGYAEQHAFLSDKVAMMCLQNPFIEQIQIYRPDMDYTVCPIPSFEGYSTASASGSFWVGIPRGAKHPRAAWEFMKFYVHKKTQLAEFEEMDEPLFPGNRWFMVFSGGNISMQENGLFRDCRHRKKH